MFKLFPQSPNTDTLEYKLIKGKVYVCLLFMIYQALWLCDKYIVVAQQIHTSLTYDSLIDSDGIILFNTQIYYFFGSIINIEFRKFN